MSHTYSAHPALALEQLESAKWKKNDGSCNKPKNKRKDMLKENFENKIQSERTVSTTNDFSEEYLVYDEDELTDNMTKGCVNYTVASEDEPDALQQRINCRNKSTVAAPDTAFDELNRLTQFQLNLARKNESLNECLSSVSSIMSSPSVSTISTPLSSPTRLTPNHQLQNSHMQCCCQKSIEPGTKIVSSEKKPGMMDTTGKESMLKHNLEQVKNKNELHHIHHHQHHHKLSAVKNGCKKFKKLDLRLGPSPYRQLLPIALCILSFAVVFSLLIIYMDTTEIRHQQFRLNMSRDYDMYGVAQDNPQLIEFLREIHMRRYPMHFVKGRDTFTTEKSQAALNIYENAYNNSSAHLNFSAQYDKHDLAPSMAQYVATLVGNKPNEGSFIQSLPGSLGHLLTAPWLAGTLNWVGIIVEPEARRYFALHKQNSQRSGLQVVQACVSPTPYPKEVTLHNEDSEVRINSLLEEETSWFNPRVKCFPLYTIMLACNRTKYDLLSLGVHGHELEILQTLPFEKLQISVISIHLPEDHEDSYSGSSQQYIQAITQFLINKSYKMVRQFGRNFFYQRQQQQNFTNRSRKKDELLLKTPSTFT